MQVNFVNNFAVANNFICKNDKNTGAKPQPQQGSIENNNYKYGYYKDYNVTFRGGTNFSDILKQVSEQMEENPEIIEALKTRKNYNDTEAIITFLKGSKMISKSPQTVLKLIERKYDNSKEYMNSLRSIQEILALYGDDSEVLEYAIENEDCSENILGMHSPLKAVPEYIKFLKQRKKPNGRPWVVGTDVYNAIAEAYTQDPHIADYVVNLANSEGSPRFLDSKNDYTNVFNLCRRDLQLAQKLINMKTADWSRYVYNNVYALIVAASKKHNN